MRPFIIRFIAVGSLAALLIPGVVRSVSPALSAQTAPATPTDSGKMVEVDPIRCWWKTSVGSVHVGQQFTLTLTCAVLQNDSVQVVPDESRLGPAAMTMTPFEVVSGTHPADLYTADRRFFQYDYVLRIINPDLIGKDTRIPDQIIHYRVNSKVSQNASIIGKDNIYDLPIIWMRILSLVPVDATDIRDSGSESFAIPESLLFRANVFEIVAAAAAALGALFLLLAFVRLFLRTRKTRKAGVARGVGEAGILRQVARELSSVQRDSAGGWDTDLVGRALGATRVAATIALGRPVGEAMHAGEANGEGRMLVTPFRRKAAVISGGITTNQVTKRLNALPDATPPATRRALEDLQAALAALTTAHYARVAAFERTTLDEAVEKASAATSALRSDRMWPKPMVRRWIRREPAAAR